MSANTAPAKTKAKAVAPVVQRKSRAAALGAATPMGQTRAVAYGLPPMVQASGGGEASVGGATEQQLTATQSGGTPLPEATQQRMEAGIGADFSGVRVHTGPEATAMNQQMGANAFTYQNHIYFNEGQYAPGNDSGDRLIAHELTHTVQQGAAVQTSPQPAAQAIQQSAAPGLQLKTKDEVLAGLAVLQKKLGSAMYEDTIQGNIDQILLENGLTPAEVRKYVKALGVEIDAKLPGLNKQIDALTLPDEFIEVNNQLLALLKEKEGEVKEAIKKLPASTPKQEQEFLNRQLAYIRNLHIKYSDKFFIKVEAYPKIVEAKKEKKTPDFTKGNLFSELKKFPIPYSTQNDANVQSWLAQVKDHLKPETRLAYIRSQYYASLSLWEHVLFPPKGTTPPAGGTAAKPPPAGPATKAAEDATGSKMSDAARTMVAKMTDAEKKAFEEYIRQQQVKGTMPKDADSLVANYKSLSKLELQVLELNQLLNIRADGGGAGAIMLDMGDTKKAATLPGSAPVNTHLASLASQVLSKMPKGKGGNSAFKDLFAKIDLLKIEMLMLNSMLMGAAKRIPAMKGANKEMEKLIKAMFDAIRDSMLADLAIDSLIALIPVVGGPAAIIKKVEKVSRLVDTIQDVMSVADKLKGLVAIIGRVGPTLKKIEALQAAADDLEKAEEAEEQIFLLIDRYNLYEYMYLPKLPGQSPEEAQAQAFKMIHDVPKGLTAVEGMYTHYQGLPSKPSNEDKAMLAVQGIKAGILGAPFVAGLKGLIFDKLKGAIASMGGSLLSKLNPFGRKKRKSKRDRNQETKDKTKKLKSQDVLYDKALVEKFIKNNHVKDMEKFLHNQHNSLGGGMWTLPFFKAAAQSKSVELSNKYRGHNIQVTLKHPKGKKAFASMKQVSIEKTGKPWQITFKAQLKGADATVKLARDTAKVKDLTYPNLKASSGLPYPTSNMQGEAKYHEEKRKKINTWVEETNSRAFKWVFEPKSDGTPDTGNEAKKHIRVKKGNRTPGFMDVHPKAIKAQLIPDAQERFLGLHLSGKFRSRAKPEMFINKLPPGFTVIKSLKIKRKTGAEAAGASGIDLMWEHGQLARDTGRATVISASKPKEANYTTEPVNVDNMLKKMFETDTAGNFVTPNALKPGIKSPKKLNTVTKWKDHIKKKPDLAKRPVSLSTRIGYTINKKRKSLSNIHLPNMLGPSADDDKGHIVAARFNGADKEFNLIPMKKSLNRSEGEWNAAERKMAKHFIGSATPPASSFIDVNMTFTYDKTDYRRPSEIALKWKPKGSSKIYSEGPFDNKP